MNEIVKKYSIYLEHGIYLTDSVDCCQQQLATQIDDNCVSALCFANGFCSLYMYIYKLNGLVGVPFSCRFLHWWIWIFQSRICNCNGNLCSTLVCARSFAAFYSQHTLCVHNSNIKQCSSATQNQSFVQHNWKLSSYGLFVQMNCLTAIESESNSRCSWSE